MKSQEQCEFDETQKYLQKKRHEVYMQLDQIKDRNVVIKVKIQNREEDQEVGKCQPDQHMFQEKLVSGPKMAFNRDEKHQGDDAMLLN